MYIFSIPNTNNSD